MDSQRQKLLSTSERAASISGSSSFDKTQPLNINESLWESQIEQEAAKKDNQQYPVIGEVSEDNGSSADEHRQILEARQNQIIVEDSSHTKKSMAQYNQWAHSQHKSIQQRIEMMPKKHRNQLINKSMLNVNMFESQKIDFNILEDGTRKSRHSFRDTELEEQVHELKFLSDLTLWQKINILIYNCLESVIICFLMFNCLIYCNLCSIMNLMIVCFISVAFVPRRQYNIKHRRNAVFSNAVVSILVLAAKIVYIGLGKAEYQYNDQKKLAWVKTIGIQYLNNRTIDIHSSIQCELISIGISLFYFVLIMNLQRAKFGKVKVKRIQTTISHPKNKRNSLYQPPLGKFELIQNQRLTQDIKPINEKILYHSFYGEFKDKFFVLLLVLMLLDSAIIQSIPQMIQFFTVILVLFKSTDPMTKKLNTFQKLENMDFVSSFTQAVVGIQVLLIYVVNIPIIKFELQNMTKYQWLIEILGLKEEEGSQPYELNRLNSHVLIICFIIQCSQLYRSASGCYQYKNKYQGAHSHLLENDQIVKNLMGENSKKIRRSQTVDIKIGDYKSDEEQTMSYLYIWNHFLFPHLLIWISRFISIFLAFFYHDWESLILLIWVTHGIFLVSTKKFSEITRRVYLPLFTIIVMFSYAININKLFPESLFQREMIWNYGFFRFSNAFAEVMVWQIFLTINFFWVKTQENVSNLDENLGHQGARFFRYMSQKNSYTFQNILILMVPNIEQFLLLIILLSGLEKVDVYHIIFLFLFINFLVFQNRKELLTRILIFSSSFFILGKYFFSLFSSEESKDFLEIIGLYTNIELKDQQTYFEYPFKIQEWLVLFMGYIQFIFQRFIHNEKEIQQCINQAKSNLKSRFPIINKYFQLVYNVKRYLMLILVFMTFFYIIQIYPRSLINWGFLIIINILFYIQLSHYKYSISEKLRYWLVMIIYSSIVILVNIVFLFCQLPYIRNKPGTKQMFDNFPKNYQNMVGLRVTDVDQLDNNLLVIFVPYLIFLIASAYIKSEIEKWHNDDQKFRQDILTKIQSKDQVPQQVIPYIAENKNEVKTAEMLIQEKENLVKEIQGQIGEVKGHYARIRFSPLFVAYSFKNIWPLFNLFAGYSNILLNLAILLLTLRWWLNLVNCLQIMLFVIFLISTGNKIQSLKSLQMKEVSPRLKRSESISRKKQNVTYYMVHDKDIIQQRKDFSLELNKLILSQRLVSWRFQYILVSLVLLIIYLSQFIDIFTAMAEEQEDYQTQEKLKTAKYYLFITGLYNDQQENLDQSISFAQGTSGYVIILLLCICEKISLSWIENKFGCDQKAYEIIDQFQKRLGQLDSQLQKAHDKIQEYTTNATIINKRAKMKMRRNLYESQVVNFESQRQSNYSMAFSSVQVPVNVQTNQNQQKTLRKEIKSRLIIDSQLNILKGFKVFIENSIISCAMVSAVIKMNVQSIVYFILIAITIKQKNNNPNKGSMRVLMNSISFFLFVRLMLILSNIDQNISPMPYPNEFSATSQEYLIPWISRIRGFHQMNDQEFSQWAYFFGLIIVPEKVNSLYIDFGIIFLMYVHYQTCQFWLIPQNFETVISQDTEQLIKQYLKETTYEISNQSSENGSDKESSGKEMKALIKEIQNHSMQYRFYKFLMRLANIWYSKLMVMALLSFSIISNTLFSLGLIFIICVLMFYNSLFLDYSSARKKLIPILRDFILFFILVEIIVNFVYQIPLPLFDSESKTLNYHIAQIMGVYKIWSIAVIENQFNYRFYKTKKVIQLACKAIIYLVVNLQIQIIESKNFIRIKDMIQHGQQQGQAITWRFNNLKIKKYLKYQNINLQKELMMIRVKENCDKWRAFTEIKNNNFKNKLFEKQAEVKRQQKFKYQEDEQLKNLSQNIAPIIMEENESDIDLSISLSSTHKQHNQSVLERSKNYFQGVNSDYLQFRKLTQRHIELKSSTLRNVYEEDFGSESIGNLILTPQEKEMKKLFKEKKMRLTFMVRLYLYIRKRSVNPILFVNDKQKMESELKNIKKGETKVLSSIQKAMLDDAKIQIKTGKETNENLESQISLRKMAVRYIKLSQQIIMSNLDTLSYFFMILATAQNPGIVTLVYPFSVFGFASMEETRPRKHFWYFIMFFTQILMIIELVFSLRFWQEIFKTEFLHIQKINSQYYIGIMIGGDFIQGNDLDLWLLFLAFLPKILILWSTITFCHHEILLKFFEKKEQDKESMFTAYKRFIQGNFDIMMDEDLNSHRKEQEDIREELNKIVFNYMLKISQDDSVLLNASKNDWLNKQEIKNHIEEWRPFKSEQDIFEDFEKVDAEIRKSKQDFKRVIQNMQTHFYKTFVSNSYLQRLYPSLKIQKPGMDFYVIMVSVQVLMCLYILIKYPQMDAEHSSIMLQVNRNQFSGHMVVVLAIMIFLMIVERYIYKSKNFTQLENIEQKNKIMEIQERTKAAVSELKLSPKNASSKKQSVPNDENLSERQQSIRRSSQKRAQEQDPTSTALEQSSQDSQMDFNLSVLARSTITLRTVGKFYFQWVTLIMIHIMLFFYLPISGNQKYNHMSYCDEELYQKHPDYQCNDLNKNSSIKIFYFLSCIYFFISALQVKHGLPEVMTSYFMMNNYHYMYKYIFLCFYYIPFIFELRCFIDWTYTKTSLDVYQWIKLNQIQADLYKAKSNNIWYFKKTVGEKMPMWYKYLVGLSLIGLILGLSLGPMFLFSSFNIFGEINPVSSTSLSFKISLEDPNGVLSTYKLFETMTIQKKQDELTEWEYKTMEFDQNYETRNFDKGQIQYLIMNNFPQENWYIPEKSKDILIQNLEGYLNRTYNETQMKFEASIHYQFTRGSPKTALTPLGSQSFNIFALKDKDFFIQKFQNALKAQCDLKKEEHSMEIFNLFSPVIQLSQTQSAEEIESDIWKKRSIKLHYDPCQRIWNLKQSLVSNRTEYLVYENITTSNAQSQSIRSEGGISLFIISRKTLPSYLNLPLMTFYITIIYALAKLFRASFVPITASIYVNDAPNPDDLLMLCETIILYRLKEKLKEEEELFFLLIDIMRSPQVFKAICGDSIKTSKLKQE